MVVKHQMGGFDGLLDVAARHDIGCILGSGLESSTDFGKGYLQEVGVVFGVIPFLGFDNPGLNSLCSVALKRFSVLFMSSVVDFVEMGCLTKADTEVSEICLLGIGIANEHVLLVIRDVG